MSPFVKAMAVRRSANEWNRMIDGEHTSVQNVWTPSNAPPGYATQGRLLKRVMNSFFLSSFNCNELHVMRGCRVYRRPCGVEVEGGEEGAHRTGRPAAPRPVYVLAGRRSSQNIHSPKLAFRFERQMLLRNSHGCVFMPYSYLDNVS